MEFDEFIRNVGQFGKYQRRRYFLLCFAGLIGAFNSMSYVFLAAVPDYWCIDQYQPSNISQTDPQQQRNHSSKCQLPFINQLINGSDLSFSKAPFTLFSPNTTKDNYSLSTVPFHQDPVPGHLNSSRCLAWNYDLTQYGETIVTEWNLVCHRASIGTTSGSIFAVGKIVGCIGFALISDKFGRKKTLLASLVMSALFGSVGAFAPEPVSYLIGRLLLAASDTGTYETAYVIGMEMVGPDFREFAGIAINFYWAAGFLVLTGLAYVIQNWFILQLVISMPALLFLFVVARFIPESPRWLLQRGQITDATKIMADIARTNGKDVDFVKTKVYVRPPEDKLGVAAVVRYPMMVYFTIISATLWFCTSLVYFGLSMNTSNLGGNPYINMALSGAVEIPAYGLSILMLNKIGRKMSHAVCFLLASVCLYACFFVTTENNTAMIALSMVGKFAISAVFGMLFVYTSELYPTAVRTTGIGFSSMTARVGMVAAPFMAMLGGIATPETPLLIFGTCSLAATLLCTLLPETKHLSLPDSLEHLEVFKSTSLLYSIRSKCTRKRPRNASNGDICSEPGLGKTLSNATEETKQMIESKV